MMTRATVQGRRVRVWSLYISEIRCRGWYWECEEAHTSGGGIFGFPCMRDAIADAQNKLGADIRVTRHTEQTPERGEGEGA